VECGCGDLVQVRDSARHWLEPVARARRRFAPGAGNLVVELRFLCAAARPGAEQAAAKALRAGRRRGGAPAGAARSLGAVVPVDSRQRMAAPVAVLASQAVIGGCGRPDYGQP
jgi:hypothetical protein